MFSPKNYVSPSEGEYKKQEKNQLMSIILIKKEKKINNY
jgi:hypothetical protein